MLAQIATELGDEDARVRHQNAWERVRPHFEDLEITERVRKRDPALESASERLLRATATPAPTGERAGSGKRA